MASEAFRQLLTSRIAHMLDTGQYIPPESLDDLQFSLIRVRDAYHDARRENAPEDRCDLLRRYIEDANYLIELGSVPFGLNAAGNVLTAGSDNQLSPTDTFTKLLTKFEKFFENVCLEHDDCKASLLSHACKHATERQGTEQEKK
jgi:hypothetical protein